MAIIKRPYGSYRGFGGAPGPTRPRDLAIAALARGGIDLDEAERAFEEQAQREAAYIRASPGYMRSRTKLFDPLATYAGEVAAVEKSGARTSVEPSESTLLAPTPPALQEQYGLSRDPFTLGYGTEQRRRILQGLVDAARRPIRK